MKAFIHKSFILQIQYEQVLANSLHKKTYLKQEVLEMDLLKGLLPPFLRRIFSSFVLNY